jgi:putative Holliday junction resolvase
MRHGRRIALDPGSVRIGVAVCDRDGILASPHEPVPADSPELLDTLIADIDPIEILVGLPRGLDGKEGDAALKARTFARDLASSVGIPVRLVDERLSTVQAQRGFHAQGRSIRQSRGMIDSASAAVVLQHALDTERATGQPPGEVSA